MKIALGLFLIAHGLVHLALWLPVPADDAPMRVGHSWLLGEIRPLTIVLAVAAMAVLVVAGVAHLAGVGWWPWAAVVGAGVSALLMVLTFTPWWLIGLGIDTALVVWALRAMD